MTSFDQYFYDKDGMNQHNVKQFSIKLEIYVYDAERGDYIPASQSKLKDEVDSCLYLRSGDISPSSSISYNRASQVTRTLNLTIRNDRVDKDTLEAINNWGSDYKNDNLKWWLDRKVMVYACITDPAVTNMSIDDFERLDSHMVEEGTIRPMGLFSITGFNTNHGVSEFPVTSISGSSSEFLFTSKRGKFDVRTSVEKGAIITETIRTLLMKGGERLSRICISPFVSDESETIPMRAMGGTPGQSTLNKWVPRTSISGGFSVTAEDDYSAFMNSPSSVKFHIAPMNNLGLGNSIPAKSLLATYDFSPSLDFTKYNALSFWVKSNIDTLDSQFELWLYDDSPSVPIQKVNVGELAGELYTYKVTTDSLNEKKTVAESAQVNNWRKVIAPLSIMHRLKSIRKIELRNGLALNKTPTLWIDDITVSNIRNTNPKDLHYNVGQNIWQAVQDLASSLKCEAYYTKDGYFTLDREPLVDPETSSRDLWTFLQNYFGPDVITNSSANMFELQDTLPTDYTQGFYNFQPFYSYADKLVNNPSQIGNLAEISADGLFNFIQPGSHGGAFVIYLDLVPTNIRQDLIDYCNINFDDPLVEWIHNSDQNRLHCNLLDLLNFNLVNLEMLTEPGKPRIQASRVVRGLFKDFLTENSMYSGILSINKEENYDKRNHLPGDVYISDLTEDWRVSEESKRRSLYISGNYSFVEGDLANHVLIVGGAAENSVVTKAELLLKEPKYVENDGEYALSRKGGILAKRKGIYINEVGRVRGMNDYKVLDWMPSENYSESLVTHDGKKYGEPDWVQYYNEETMTYHTYKCIVSHGSTASNHPFTGENGHIYWKEDEKGIWFNSDTKVREVYERASNVDMVEKIVGSDKFGYLEEQPYSNFTIERIGDMLFALNNGAPTPLITYVWEAMNAALFEMEEKLQVNEILSMQTTPFFGVDVRDIIQVHDRHLGIYAKRFIVDSVTMPLNGSAFSISGISYYKPHLDIPYFEEGHRDRYGPYFYGYDVADYTNKSLNPGDSDYHDPSFPPRSDEFNGINLGDNYQFQSFERRREQIIEKEIPSREKSIEFYKKATNQNYQVPGKVAEYLNLIDKLEKEIVNLNIEIDSITKILDSWVGSPILNKGNKPRGYVSIPREGLNPNLHYYTRSEMYEFFDLSFFEAEEGLAAGYLEHGAPTGNVTVNYLTEAMEQVKNKQKMFAMASEETTPEKEVKYTDLLPQLREENVSEMTIIAPTVEGYALRTPIEQYNYVAQSDRDEAEFNFIYEESIKGDIRVRHIGVFGDVEQDLCEPLFYPDTSIETVRAKSYNGFRLIGSETQKTLMVEKNGDVLEYAFYYRPRFTWKVTSNLHNLGDEIEPVLMKRDFSGLKRVLSRRDSLYFVDSESYAYFVGDNIFLSHGGGLGDLLLGLHSNSEEVVNPLITISVQGYEYSEFFDSSHFSSIRPSPFDQDDYLLMPIKTVGEFKFDYGENSRGSYVSMLDNKGGA